MTQPLIHGLLLLTVLSFGEVSGVTVGQACEDSTECGTGNFCAGNKRCACLATYIAIDGYCFEKVNPGDSGCSQNEQCDAVSPGAYCSIGACVCANNRPPFRTRDGLICINYGFCPTNGNNAKLRVAGETVPCTADNSCVEFGGYAYDCFCNGADCTVAGVITYCCPSRAWACAQKQEIGTGTDRVNRWYYDSISDECKDLRYRGNGGNGNNFETKAQCESYCKTSCDRGRPLYTTPVFGTQKGQVLSCARGASCGNANYGCVTNSGVRRCCPTTAFICSQQGGIPLALYQQSISQLPATPSHPGFCSDAVTCTAKPRYFFNANTNQCESFQYLGAGGNFNNFLSQSHCEQYCAKLVCPAGSPLKDVGGEINQRCTGSDDCPSSHTCKTEFNVCCPTPEYVCKLPLEGGICGDSISRWWFNAATGNCESFVYSGCKSNANNFDGYEDCQSYCRDVTREVTCPQGKALQDSNRKFLVCGGTSATSNCPANYYCFYDGTSYGCCATQAYTCSLNSVTGRICGPSVTRWFFDTTRRECRTFTFSGCDGNPNNFATQQDCNEYCRVEACPDGGELYRDVGGRERICATNRNCPSTHFCTTITRYTGSSGFTTTNYCCPTKNFICSRPRDTGVRCSSSTILRWYFNGESKSCQRFDYNGCQGNRNNFANQQQCQNYCLSSACPPGTVVQLNPTDARIISCSNTGESGRRSGGCTAGYTCYNAPLLGQNVCCGTSASLQALCPANSPPYVNALSLEVLQCQPNVDGSCPGNYFCWYSTGAQVNEFYCCFNPESSSVVGFCPPGLSPISGSGNQEYRYCSPSAPPNDATSGCGSNRHCQYADNLGRYICCGSDTDSELTDICPPEPKDLEPVNLGGNYRNCNPQAVAGTPQACPTRAACLFTGTEQGYICCKIKLTGVRTTPPPAVVPVTLGPTAPPVSEDCSGQLGFLPVEPYGAACSPFDVNSCNNYRNQGSIIRCLFSSRQTKFICCRSQFRRARGRKTALAASRRRYADPSD